MDNELRHHGILGMKWGRRRFQNSDGTLTEAGKKRYNKEMEKLKAEEKILKNKQRTQAKIAKLDAKRKEIDDLRDELDNKKNSSKKKTTPLDDISDKDLESLVKRMQNEDKYVQLMKERQDRGKSFFARKGKELGIKFVDEAGKKATDIILGKLQKKLFSNNSPKKK